MLIDIEWMLGQPFLGLHSYLIPNKKPRHHVPFFLNDHDHHQDS